MGKLVLKIMASYCVTAEHVKKTKLGKYVNICILVRNVTKLVQRRGVKKIMAKVPNVSPKLRKKIY